MVIACRVMAPELDAVRGKDSRVDIRYLDQALHRTPRDMAGKIQELINEAPANAEAIVLGYGLCSNGIVGVTAGHQGLLVPRAHDCISFFLGSPAAYQKSFSQYPGTYYLTPGWVAERKDPLGIVEFEYIPKFGEETGWWVMTEELKHYTHIALLDTGIGDMKATRSRAKENARRLEKTYLEIPCRDREFFSRLLRGPYSKDFFIHLSAGQCIAQEMFLES